MKELGSEKLFEVVKRSQFKNFDPCDPPTHFANDLHASIVEEMGVDYSSLEYYPATSSHLDYTGVDAFFIFKYIDEDLKEKRIRVCIDLSGDTFINKNEKLQEKIKPGAKSLSDLILFVEKEDYSRKREDDKKNIKDFSKKIIKVINEKIEKEKNKKIVGQEKLELVK